ncbi:hypothetical protein Tco_0025576, partial [Tanacetum coccineum]
FTFHECAMDPLDISRNPSKEKGKRVSSPSVTSSSSSSSDDNEGTSFLEFYDELSDNEDLAKAQREKRVVILSTNFLALGMAFGGNTRLIRAHCGEEMGQRLQTYTKSSEDFCKLWLETAVASI